MPIAAVPPPLSDLPDWPGRCGWAATAIAGLLAGSDRLRAFLLVLLTAAVETVEAIDAERARIGEPPASAQAPRAEVEHDAEQAGQWLGILLQDVPDVLALMRCLCPMVVAALPAALEEVRAIRRDYGLPPPRTGPPRLTIVERE